MTIGNVLFCTHCGRNIDRGVRCCPECGNNIYFDGKKIDYDLTKEEKAHIESRATKMAVTLTVFFIPMTVIAAVMMVLSFPIAEYVSDNSVYISWVDDSLGYSFSIEDLESLCLIFGSTALVGGLCGAISLMCVTMRESWGLAYACCFAAAFLCFWSVIGMGIALFAGKYIYNSKHVFTNIAPDV